MATCLTFVARRVVLVLCCLLVSGALAAQSGDVEGFRPIDVDGDGDAEVQSVRSLGEAGDEASPKVIVLVEQRLLTERGGITSADREALMDRLKRHGQDLARAGYHAHLLAVEVYSGPRHQDGRTVLGIRRLLQHHAQNGRLAGALLVGHFPDAKLVRTCNWHRTGELQLPGRDGKPIGFGKETPWLRRVPELVAHKFDLVLADLDGNWESLYVGAPANLERVEAVFADPTNSTLGGPCAAMRSGSQSYADVFHVADGAVAVRTEDFSVVVNDETRDHECSAQDRESVNAIARPEISVSRIDARGAAFSPEPAYVDEHGFPREVTFATDALVPRWDSMWQPDPRLELRLLCEYFDRNHSYRTNGVDHDARKPASISWGLGSGMNSLRPAEASWASFAEPGYDVSENVDLKQLFEWLKRPALLRTLRAHSDGRYAAFQATDTAALEKVIGGTPYGFAKRGHSLVPSLRSACATGHANFFLYRTLWANHALPSDPFFLIHTGCEAMSPPHHQRPFQHPSYGALQHAESILFYTPCLALVGRAKVFYDEPRDFVATLGRGGTFGDAWRRYYAVESSAESWGAVGGDIGRKRSYFWSLLGDWTLTMPRE